MALDSAQNVYRRSMTWNPPGLTARGRTTVFRRNYRNTREILELAWTFLEGSPDCSPPVSDGVTPRTVSSRRRPPEAVRYPDCSSAGTCGARPKPSPPRSGASPPTEWMSATSPSCTATAISRRSCRRPFRQRRLPYFHIQYQDRRGRRPNRDIAMGVRDKVRGLDAPRSQGSRVQPGAHRWGQPGVRPRRRRGGPAGRRQAASLRGHDQGHGRTRHHDLG